MSLAFIEKSYLCEKCAFYTAFYLYIVVFLILRILNFFFHTKYVILNSLQGSHDENQEKGACQKTCQKGKGLKKTGLYKPIMDVQVSEPSAMT